MLSLLAPSALFGLSLLAIPLVIHLLKPRKVRRTPFSSLRWLHTTQQRLAWRIRWHQVLLFLLRAAFIVLLVMAIAKPIFSRHSTAQARERFVVVDVSRSMSYHHGNRPSPFESAKELAARLRTSGDGTRTALLATGAHTRVLGGLAADGDRYLPALSALEPGLTESNLGSAFDKINALLSQRRDNSEVEVYFITDNHLGCWQQGAIEAWVKEQSGKVKGLLVDVADPAPQNGWIAACRVDDELHDNQRSLLVQLRCVGSAQQRTLRLSGLEGLSDRTESVNLEPGVPTEVRFELPLDYQARGQVLNVTLEPADGLPSDDRWIYSLDPRAVCRVLIVEGSPQPHKPVPPGFALRTAIEALISAGENIRLTTKKYNEVQPEDFRDVDAVLWADVPQMSETALHALEDRVKGGLGLAVFLGPGVEKNFYNTRLFNTLDRSAGLLPVSLERVEEVPLSRGGLAPLLNIAWQHPLFAGLFDPELGDLAQTQMHTLYRFAAAPVEADPILATVAEAPAVVEHRVGDGKVLLFNTTATDAWGNLPRRKSFVPLVDRLLNDLSGGVMQRSFLVGEDVKLLVPPTAEGETITVRGPDGIILTPTTTPLGHRLLLRLPGLTDPGVYQVQRSQETKPDFAFIVQPGRQDSMLTETSHDLLNAWWQPAKFEIVPGDIATERLAAAGSQVMLSTWLILLAALVLAIETFLANWFCPRVTPTMAPSVIQNRRLVVTPMSAELKAL